MTCVRNDQNAPITANTTSNPRSTGKILSVETEQITKADKPNTPIVMIIIQFLHIKRPSLALSIFVCQGGVFNFIYFFPYEFFVFCLCFFSNQEHFFDPFDFAPAHWTPISDVARSAKGEMVARMDHDLSVHFHAYDALQVVRGDWLIVRFPTIKALFFKW